MFSAGNKTAPCLQIEVIMAVNCSHQTLKVKENTNIVFFPFALFHVFLNHFLLSLKGLRIGNWGSHSKGTNGLHSFVMNTLEILIFQRV